MTGGFGRSSLFMLGTASMITQVMVMRSMLTMFSGNELIVGIILSAWMILTAFGSFLGGRIKVNGFVSQFFLPLLALATISLGPLLYGIFLPAGIEPGPLTSSLLIFSLLTPFCVLSGALFPSLVGQAEKHGRTSPAKAYTAESIGSVIGSLSVTIILYSLKDPYWIEMAIPVLYSVILVIAFAARQITTAGSITGFLVILAAFMYANFRSEPVDRTYSLWREQVILEESELPAGKLSVLRHEEQINVFFNHKPLFSSGEELSQEESVHIPLSLHEKPDHILVVSNGTPGILAELSKYDPVEVDYVEVVTGLREVLSNHFEYPEGAPFNYYSKDVRDFLDQTAKKYDVVIVDAPLPTSAAMNRYYTVEFFRTIAEHLEERGILAIETASSQNYLGKESLRMNSIIASTLAENFPFVRPVSASNIHYIASRQYFDIEILNKIEERNISTRYVNRYYFDEESVRFRSILLENDLEKDPGANHDFHPLAYSGYLDYWLERHGKGTLGLAVVLGLTFLIFLIRLPLRDTGIFMAGFTGGSLQFMLLVAYQVLFGTLYLQLGAIVAAFMTGLAAGAWTGQRIGIRNLRSYGFLLLLFALVTFISGYVIPRWEWIGIDRHIIKIMLYVMMVITGFFTGSAFSAGTCLSDRSPRSTSSGSYASDLAGSAVGSMGVAIFILPIAGLEVAAFIIAGIQAIVALRVVLMGKIS